MLYSQKWLLIGVLIILTIGLICVGFYASRESVLLEKELKTEIKGVKEEIRRLKENIEQLKKRISVELEEISSIDISNWKTYRNERYRYMIKYPRDWVGEDSSITNYASFVQKEMDGAGIGFWIRVHENPSNLSFDNWWKQYSKGWTESYSYKGSFLISSTIKAEIYEPVDRGSFALTYYLISRDQKIYLISTTLIREKFDPILFIFRFIEKVNEIKVGKLPINYDEVTKLQKLVDKGHQPWRLVPEMVAYVEGLAAGFTDEDFKTMKTVLKELEKGVVEYRISHKSNNYILTVTRPFVGEDKIFILSEIKLEK